MTRWRETEIRELIRRLAGLRAECSATTLAEVEHSSRSPFRLLVACVISLRTRDDVTSAASERLFAIAADPYTLAATDETTIANAIYPAGFYRTKARQLRALAALIVDQHGGEVPASEEALLALPGVGRKTSNLVRGLGFGIPAICVDTHVHRISNRLGLVASTTPAETERLLEELLPRDLWIEINDLLVTFGQNCCQPTSPRCSECPVAGCCPRLGVSRSR